MVSVVAVCLDASHWETLLVALNFVKDELFRLKFSILITHPIRFLIDLLSLSQNISASSGKKVKEKCYFSVLQDESIFFSFCLCFCF